jgi:hypothetical protein
MGLFTIFDRITQRQYPGKLFYFDQLLVYTEFVNLQLEYRGHYLGEKFGICDYEVNTKICLCTQKLGEQEVEFRASNQQLKEWYNLLSKVLMNFAAAGMNNIKRNSSHEENLGFEHLLQRTESWIDARPALDHLKILMYFRPNSL